MTNAKNVVTRACGHEVITMRTNAQRLENLRLTPCTDCVNGRLPSGGRRADQTPKDDRSATESTSARLARSAKHKHVLDGGLRWKRYSNWSVHLVPVCSGCGKSSHPVAQTPENIEKARSCALAPENMTWSDVAAEFGNRAGIVPAPIEVIEL